MKRIFYLLACLTVLMSGFKLESTSNRTIKAIGENSSFNCDKRIYSFISRNEEIEFDCLGLKRKKEKSYRISARDLSVSKDEDISQVFYADFENDLILIFDKSNNESGSIEICRIDFMKPLVKWKTEMPSMNPSYGKIESQFLYQAGVGFISKINLKSGLFEWKHGELVDSKTGSYFEFCDLILKERFAFFLVKCNEDGLEKEEKVICVNKTNGEIVPNNLINKK
jgi:hypothetical protein